MGLDPSICEIRQDLQVSNVRGELDSRTLIWCPQRIGKLTLMEKPHTVGARIVM